jgi:hypothetical protein
MTSGGWGFGVLDFLSLVCFIIPLVVFAYLVYSKYHFFVNQPTADSVISTAANWKSDSNGAYIIGAMFASLSIGFISKVALMVTSSSSSTSTGGF